MNVNEKLIGLTAEHLPKYGCYPGDFERVLLRDMGFEERQRAAIDFINGVLTKHGKERLRSYVAELAAVEHGIKELQPRQRDHVVHVVRVFLLGIFFNETLLGDDQVDPLQWKLAGLTHDVGYPLEIAAKVATPFRDKLNSIAAELGVNVPEVRYRAPRLEGLENLTEGRNGLALIQARFQVWGVPIDAFQAYHERTQEGSVCHGIISALAVLRVLDLLYAKSNPKRVYESTVIHGVDWNQKWFDTDNVSACAGIFLHNLDLKWFEQSRLNRHRGPVAFLLRLADTLQEWDRPSGHSPEGMPADLFDVDADGGGVVFRAKLTDGHKDYLRRALDAALEDHRVRIE